MKIAEISTPKYGYTKNLRVNNTEENQTLNLTQPSSKMKLATLPSTSQYLAFAGGYSLNLAQTIKGLDKIAEKTPNVFPPNVREWAQLILEEGNRSKDTLISIHKKLYEGLLDCTTLQEAKMKFPEFEQVVSADSVTARSNSFLSDFKDGKLEYFDNDEDLALQILKLYWAKGFSLNDLKRYAGDKQMLSVIRKLNIPLVNRTYGQILKLSDVEYNIRLMAEMKERRLAKLDRIAQETEGEPVFIKRGPLSEEHKARISEGLKRHYDEHPEALLELSERQKEFYRNHPERAIALRRVALKAWSEQSSTIIIRKMLHFMNQHGSKTFDPLNLAHPMNLSAQDSTLLKKFWLANPKSKETLSRSMKYAWKRVKEDEGVTHSIKLLPQGLVDRMKAWAAKKGVELEDKYLTTQYTPSNGEIIRPELFQSKVYDDFVSTLPGGKEFIVKLYLRFNILFIDGMQTKTAKKGYFPTISEKKLEKDFSDFIKQDAVSFYHRDYASFYEYLMRNAIYESNTNLVQRFEKCFNKAYEQILEESQKEQQAILTGITRGRRSTPPQSSFMRQYGKFNL